MAYKVKLTAPAEADAYAAYEYIRELAPRSAEKWLKEFFRRSLPLMRCPRAVLLSRRPQKSDNRLDSFFTVSEAEYIGSSLTFKSSLRKALAFGYFVSGMGRETKLQPQM